MRNLQTVFDAALTPHRVEVPSGMCFMTVLSGTNANPYLESRWTGRLRPIA
ncbi:MAG: hypothetical protein HOV78_00245 [Hamadaea sp.]|uniref:hypothetical protein n=1 Tax=Hamadaea sp. NPDC050747 TaxID=3155789 RepID=UPI0017EB377F|nr:hypothetical protein [Hamadaea sp.]